MLLIPIKKEFQKTVTPDLLVGMVRDILTEEHPFDQHKEHLFAIGMDIKNRIQYIDLVSLGILDSTHMHPRESFRHAISEGVFGLILLHNHPSTEAEPSGTDIRITKRFVAAGKILGIPLLDHIIVTPTESYSFREYIPDIF